MADYYRVLGLQQGASQEQIKASFRKQALIWHPDRHATASEQQRAEASARFKIITEAYDTLTDDCKRAAYHATTRAGAAGYSASQSYQQSSYYSYRTADTSWTNAYYQARKSQSRNRIPLWQRFQRAVGSRKAEAAAFFVLMGLGTLGVAAIEPMWRMRNKGRSFEEMQQQQQ